MSNIRKAFENGKAFIPFITCGDPDLETTKAAVREMVKNGADLIELGIPFSDPTAEGPVIMHADQVALEAGTTTDKVFALTKQRHHAHAYVCVGKRAVFIKIFFVSHFIPS